MHTMRKLYHRRRGASLIYVAIIVTAMMGLCSLAVDMGRYELAHAQGYNACVAAARAGAAAMAKSGATASSVTTAATNMATRHSVDGQTVTSSMVTVQFINWDSSSNTGTTVTTANFSQANAVEVYVTYSVPLVFAQALGYAHKNAIESSIAEVVTNVDTPYVAATGNPWLAGEPTGTTGSQADPNWSSKYPNSDHLYQKDIAGPIGQNTNGGTASTSTYSSYEPYCSPVQVAFTVTPGATIMITQTTSQATSQDSWDHNTAVFTDPTGNGGGGANSSYDNAASGGISEHGMSDCTAPLGSILGVFLGSSLPDNISTVPSALNFSTQTARDYVGLEPKLQQVFYAGNGQTSSSKQQEIIVPANATRLFFGIQDGWEWNNNNGGFNITVTQVNIVTVK